MGQREGKEAHEVEKVQRAKGRWDGVGVPGVRARGALPGEARAPHGTLLPGALRRFDGWPARPGQGSRREDPKGAQDQGRARGPW